MKLLGFSCRSYEMNDNSAIEFSSYKKLQERKKGKPLRKATSSIACTVRKFLLFARMSPCRDQAQYVLYIQYKAPIMEERTHQHSGKTGLHLHPPPNTKPPGQKIVHIGVRLAIGGIHAHVS